MKVVALLLLALPMLFAEDLSYLTPDITQIAQHRVQLDVDSSVIALDKTARSAVVTVWEHIVQVEGAHWLKLELNESLKLGFDTKSGPFLRITSLYDGASQLLDAVSVQEWYYTTAYFNGDAVKLELVANPVEAVVQEMRVHVVGSLVGDAEDGTTFKKAEGPNAKSICDGRDYRIYSPEQLKAARYIGSGGCSGWIFNDQFNCFFTAGHCGVNAQGSGTIQFNVPLSTTTGAIQHPPPDEQFSVDRVSVQMVNGGVGNDWGYFGTFLNSNTGLSAFQHVRGHIYTLAQVSPPTSAALSIHIAGHGVCETAFPQGACASRQYSQVNKNDTHTGGYTFTAPATLRYRTDTTGGNSGSGVEVVYNFLGGRPETWRYEAIGIHTHGGCTATGGSNAGTALQNVGWTNARNRPLGVCVTGPQNTPLRKAQRVLNEVHSTVRASS